MKEEKKYKCEKDLRDIIIKERIGSPSLYGQVFRACLKNSDCKLAFKKIRLTKEDIDILYYYYCFLFLKETIPTNIIKGINLLLLIT